MGIEDKSNGDLTAWVEELRAPTPEEEARIDKIMDEMLAEELGRPPRVSSQQARLVNAQKNKGEFYARQDVQSVGSELIREIDEGKLSISALTAWRRHLLDNFYSVPPSNNLLKELPPVTGVNPAILEQTHLDTHEQLGSNVESILFTGVDFHSIVLARAILLTPQAMHSSLSSTLGELRRVVSRQSGKPEFGYWVNRR